MLWVGALVDRLALPGVPLFAQASGPATGQSADAAGAGALLGYDLTVVFVFTLFGIAFVVTTVAVVGRILRPTGVLQGEPAKKETYECGEPAVGSSWVRFDIRFYTVALIFLIFDVEVAFLFPWAVVFKDLRSSGVGLFVFLEMMVFVAILVVGFVYCWKKGDMDWVKSKESQDVAPVPVAPESSGDESEAGAARQEPVAVS